MANIYCSLQKQHVTNQFAPTYLKKGLLFENIREKRTKMLQFSLQEQVFGMGYMVFVKRAPKRYSFRFKSKFLVWVIWFSHQNTQIWRKEGQNAPVLAPGASLQYCSHRVICFFVKRAPKCYSSHLGNKFSYGFPARIHRFRNKNRFW